MKLCAWTVLILGGLLAAPLWAQRAGEVAEIRETMQKEKDKVIALEMNLTESEKKTFWPLYNEYQEALKIIQDRAFKLLAAYGQQKGKETFSDAKARAFLEEYLDMEREKLWLKRAYVEKFSKILPPTKVMRYFQLENKVAIMVDYQITQAVPLAK